MTNDINEPSRAVNYPQLQRSQLAFPVVGIGASAGGLEALMRLFENTPASTDMAFVVVLHLSPGHESNAGQIIQRVTRMPVIQVKEKIKIEQDHIYIIAPKMQLSMNDGFLEVKELKRERGRLTAIDDFFRTLAEVHRERSVAMVLSGSGTDGAVGLARIKEQGGITLAQAPNDAEYADMPQAAVATGVIDFTLPVVEIPQKLVELWANAARIELPSIGEEEELAARPPSSAADAEAALIGVITALCTYTGHDFRHYKRATVLRRIERRMQVRAVSTLSDYLAILESDPKENIALLADMLIGVTNFFRDREAFDTLERELIPELFRQNQGRKEIRVWSAACSTGEEAYSIAMILAEQAELMSEPPNFQIFASDVDDNAIKVGRAGIYPSAIITDVSPSRLREFFIQDGERYRIRQFVRDRVLFAAHNLLQDPPFSELDLITCRNLLIYLNRDVQVRLLKMFHFALKPGGLLFLGSSESADAVEEYFVCVDKKSRIYCAKAMPRSSRTAPSLDILDVNKITLPTAEKRSVKRKFSYAEVHHRALIEMAEPSVIVDSKLDIVHMSKRAGRYMRFDGGEPTRNIVALILPELRLDLRTALYQSEQNGLSNTNHEVLVVVDGRQLGIVVSAKRYVDEEASAKFTFITLKETERPEENEPVVQMELREDLVVTQLESELQRTREQLQETIEHAEISTEELRASNEELQAINEELRSATEELETSREELQSVNEELITVNYELKMKVDETSKANDDLNNLIASTDIATIFVDRGTRIKRFTPRATDIFNIIGADIGRSLSDITHRLLYDELVSDIATTLESLGPIEREVRRNDGRYYIARLRPYRTEEDRIEGVVMTFFDVSGRREAEERARAGEERMRLVAESTNDHIIITLDTDGYVTSWNKGAERCFGYSESEMLGQSGDIIFTPEDQAEGVPQQERLVALNDGRAEDERWHLRKDGTRFYCSGVMTPLYRNEIFSGYAKIARDSTERITRDWQLESAFTKEQASRYSAESQSALKDEFLAIMSHELRHPLNMIHINIELLSRMPDFNSVPAGVKSLNIIRNSVVSQAKIIEDLLDMSRLNTGKLTLSHSKVLLCEIVSSIVEVTRADPLSKDLDIILIDGDHNLVINADTVRIEQVVLNLLGNAVKFTPPGGKIFVRLTRENNEAKLEVADTGKGISPDFISYVFDMFGQAASATSRTTGGLGIGLALVRQIVELHGGRVEARSEGIGCGAQFSIWLPLVMDANEYEPQRQASADILRGLNILVVDDAHEMVGLFKDLLEMEGAVVTTAESAAAGIELLKRENFDLLISDISMPGTDGYTFMRQVRLLPGLQDLPAIALTGLGRQKDVHLALAAGFSAHVCKPVSLDALRKEIAGLQIRGT